MTLYPCMSALDCFPTPTESTLRRKLLVISAAPLDQPTTRGLSEIHAIKAAHAPHRHLRIDVVESANIDGFRRALLRHSPTFIHIIMHGNDQGLMFEDELGYARLITHDHLASFFLAHRPRFVMLSACHSTTLAAKLAEGGVAALGFRGAVTAAAALEFARGLHDALAARRSLEFAVEEGRRTAIVHGHVLQAELHLPGPMPSP